MAKFLRQHASSLLLSLLLHGVLFSMLAVTLTFAKPSRPTPQIAIQAVAVDASSLDRLDELAEQRRIEQERLRREESERRARQAREEEAQRQREAEEQAERLRLAEEKRRAEIEAQRRAEEQARLEAEEAEKRRVAEEERQKAEAEAKRKAEEEARRRAEAEAKRKAEEEARRKAEAERQRREAEARAARQDELRAAMEAEEAFTDAVNAGELDRYKRLIDDHIERNWIRPPSARVGLDCEVFVKQIPGGDVIDVRVGRCNGDDAVRRSIEAAVLKASPLPRPPNPALFDRNLILTFKPDS